MKEFELIDTYFQQGGYQRKDVLAGIGDDCAITHVPEGQSLAVTTDTLVSGVHFPEHTSAKHIAHKAMAVNLSDLAAMGAEPAWVSLSLSMPDSNEAWLAEFSSSLLELCAYYNVQLIGGDTVRGPLSITITAHGFVPVKTELTRNGAKPGDWLYVTGTLGDAGLGLDIVNKQVPAYGEHKQFLLKRLNAPTPRVLEGTALRRIANACIDISDGLLADLKHVLHRSGCGAIVQVDNLPFSVAMRETVPMEQAIHYALSSGDDYELLFTVSEEQRGNLDTVLSNYHVSATCIGQMTGVTEKLEVRRGSEPFSISPHGYQHFATPA
ncbi:thiamine-phosphate kinase [Aestuariibacter salexigens]|uniref:thiamine-phosphate kinase n=1 Tax=Aestuariibacter salexigens TaxID=226010 RepID=UPI000404CA31|nr:thiamine-phosphate kinase [Aestuariibacter salexigens]